MPKILTISQLYKYTAAKFVVYLGILKNLLLDYMNNLLKTALTAIISLSVIAGCSKSSEKTPTPDQKDFTIEQTDLTQGSFGVKITPRDNEATYYFNLITKAEFNSLYSNDSDKLTQAYKAWFEQIAEANDLALEDLLTEALQSGMQNYPYTALTPETEYVFFVYGLDVYGNTTTDVDYYEFKTPKAEINHNTKFTITPTEVGSTYFVVDIEPDDPDVFYWYDIMPSSDYEEYCASDPSNIPSFVNTFLTSLKSENDTFSAMTEAEFVSTITKRGKTTYDTALSEVANSLLPEYDYYVFAIGVANDGSFTTEPTVIKVRTAETPRNEYIIKTSSTTDISYNADIYAKYSEAFAVMLERAVYFEGETDEQMVADLLAANGGDLTQYLQADRAKVEFTNLIPNEDYYLFIFACNTDGTPKTGSKANIQKVAVKTNAAVATGAEYTINIFGISKTSAKVNITGNDAATDQTFLMNIISKENYDKITASASESEALRKDMDDLIDRSLEEWNKSHAKLDRKEYLSRLLPNESQLGTGTSVTMDGLTSGTTYYIYVIGIKADGTYTTEPFKKDFTTIADKLSKISLSCGLTASMYEEFKPNQTCYRVTCMGMPFSSTKAVYGKFFQDTDEWAGKSGDEIKELLLKETPGTYGTWYYGDWFNMGIKLYTYAIGVDTDGVPTDIWYMSHTSKAESGVGDSGVSKEITPDETKTLTVTRE